MIYKDILAATDTDDLPRMRHDDLCINCGNGWLAHSGWGCYFSATFKDTGTTNRYVTQSMLDSLKAGSDSNREGSAQPSITSFIKGNPESFDLSDWRAWRNSSMKPNECPCGIVRVQCDYHK